MASGVRADAPLGETPDGCEIDVGGWSGCPRALLSDSIVLLLAVKRAADDEEGQSVGVEQKHRLPSRQRWEPTYDKVRSLEIAWPLTEFRFL